MAAVVPDSPPGSPPLGAQAIGTAYDASYVTFRVLRAFGWAPLLNLGYYPFGTPFTFLNFLVTPFLFAPILRLPAAQLRLVQRSVALLDLPRGRRVLDVGCGRGTSAFVMACMFPHAQVAGIDVLPENVAVARTLYGNTPNLTYGVGDAMQLDVPDRSVDRVLCLEAAFHFPNRAQFLRELSRVVDTGARLVIVDFMWKDDAARASADDEYGRVVRRIWQWDTFDSVGDYLHNARVNGFAVDACLDWSSHVTAPIQTVFDCVAALCQRGWGRGLLLRLSPLLRALSDDDWREFVRAARAHRELHRRTQYTALVLTR
jgi:MPBQ/MSBQ methyltransferase